MQNLIEHAQRTELRPAEALGALVKVYDEQAAANGPDLSAFQPPNPQMNLTLPPQRQASLAGAQNPGGFSPQVANMNMPMQMAHLNGGMAGSPQMAGNPQLNMLQQQQQQQMGSPMVAPNMAPQHSGQGSISGGGAGTSSNTSPQVSGKRRRSQIKLEDDAGGGGPDATGRVKASPRIGGPNKKTKP